MMTCSRWLWLAASGPTFGFLLAFWELALENCLVNRVFMPPTATWDALFRGITGGICIAAGRDSQAHGPWLAADLAAEPGAWHDDRIFATGQGPYERPAGVLPSLAAAAVVPATIKILGFGEFLALEGDRFFSAVWPTLLATVHGLAKVEPRLCKVGVSLQLMRRDVVLKNILAGDVVFLMRCVRRAVGWGTWIRTRTNGVRVIVSPEG